MDTATTHHISFGTRTLGGSPIRGGGIFRCSEVYCSCGEDCTENGQTYQESVQWARDHLKEVGVYNTQGEQTVFANMHREGGITLEELAERSAKKKGIVLRALNAMIERGNVEERDGLYYQTSKWYSWND